MMFPVQTDAGQNLPGKHTSGCYTPYKKWASPGARVSREELANNGPGSV